ncbi:MAG: DUF4342 domain-containing protein [Bacillota bacterium]|nr:DUF4342 domain-containing protein [Bacillota bacterium]
MEITLEKIELVKDRTGVSYKEAKEALEAADGSVVDAIIAIEETIDIKGKGKVNEQAAKIMAKVKEAVKKGNVSKLVVKKDDETVMNLPLNVGIVGTVLAPVAILAGIITIFGTKCTFELVKEDGSVIDITESLSDTFDDVVEKSSVIVDEAKVKGSEVFETMKEKAGEAIAKARKEEDFFFDDEDEEECKPEDCAACEEKDTCEKAKDAE